MSGQFFHIDFGHFLGHFKKVGKIRRERVPLVFTPAMQYVMNKYKLYDKFLEWVVKAYQTLRTRHRFFCNLFALMIPAGMPELTKGQDISYLLNKLQLNLNEEEAKDALMQTIKYALADRIRIFDNAIHAWIH